MVALAKDCFDLSADASFRKPAVVESPLGVARSVYKTLQRTTK